MVNHGVSRGCETCRRRKKKCDEGRPTCNRCEKAGIPCLGFRSPDQLLFRHHVLPIPPPTPMSEHQQPGSAVQWVLDQYVIGSGNLAVSRGFLNGLPALVSKSHPASPIMQATEIVGWASLGKMQKRPDLLARARTQHALLLNAVQGLMDSCGSSGPTLEVLVTVVLLGLYEIISGGGDYLVPEQGANGRDICALLLGPNSPFDFLTSIQSFQIGNPLLLNSGLQVQYPSGLIWKPTSSTTVHELDPILARCQFFLKHANGILQDPLSSWIDLQKTFGEAIVIKNQFSRWESTEKDTHWTNKVVGHITQADADASPCPYVSPGPVHSYSAIYTAAVMNTYRVTYLSVLDVLIRLAPRCDFRNGQTLFEWENHAWVLIGDFVASISFHLAVSPEEYVASVTSQGDLIPLGRHVGGLFLLHPLYGFSSIPLVPPYYRQYARGCLAWIGENMGIGLASVLSKVGSFDQEDEIYAEVDQEKQDVATQTMTGWQVLIWAGSMLQSDGDNQS
ncbi:hypothetical protein BDV19DRAFT_353491 [Aspergillus venezuelensis]